MNRMAAFLFCIAPTLAGMLAAQVGFHLPKLTSPWHYPAGWPPLWLFWSVWLLIYPSWGYATYLVWKTRHLHDVRGAVALFFVSIVSGLFFVPTASLSGDNPAVMSLADANGVILSWAVVWLYSRYADRAKWFLAPLVVWMPITLLLKLWYWRVNL